MGSGDESVRRAGRARSPAGSDEEEIMKTMRLGGLALAMVTCVGALSGCAADSVGLAPASPPPVAPPPPVYVDQGAPAGATAPSPGPMAAEAPAAAPRVSSRGGGERRAEAQPSRMKEEEGPRKDRPGLGTEWGETRQSSISMVSFERADPSSPFATASLFYNDEAGARAMSPAGLRRIPSAT